MEFLKKTLPNGLEIVAECNDAAYSTAMGFFVKTGARDENDAIAGVSHFLEHMMFKGTPTRSADDVNREFDEMGAHYNAFTNEENTVYYAAVLPEYLAEQAEEMMKSSYNLEFLGIRREVKERELEDRLISRLQAFILELGYGFCFVGRQHRLALGQKEYFIDLLFYHRFLKALVAFELKVGAFEPEHAGKMDFYLNLLNDKERGDGDQPSIGIILCAEKDDVEVEYALRTKANPIGVAAYQLQSKLPAELKGKLPTAKQLADVVRTMLPGRSAP